MRNAGLEETQSGIKIAGRNINNLRYADDTTLMAESAKGLSRVFYNTTVQKHQFFGSWEICMQVRKQRLELDMEKQTGSK